MLPRVTNMNKHQLSYKREATIRNTRLYDFYEEAFPRQGVMESIHSAIEDNYDSDLAVLEHLKGVN